MKTRFKIVAITLATLLFCGNVVAAAETGDISIEQRRAQVHLFDEALRAFGASTPLEAIRLWVRGDETRNGVFKYAVACDGLKKQLTDKWGPPEDSYWIIGGSSPWLTKYEVQSLTKKSGSQYGTDSIYLARVKYDWATSSGPFNSTTETLTLIPVGRRWCVADASGNGNY